MDIIITSTIAAQQPEMPSHLEPGLGNDISWFKVLLPPYFNAAMLSHLLAEECSEWILTTYDENTGVGAFLSIDFEGPHESTVIKLSSTKPIPENRTILYVREKAKLFESISLD